MPRFDDPLLAETPDGTLRGSWGYAVLGRQGFVARQGVAGAIAALADRVEYRLCDMQVRRAGAAALRLCHVAHGTGNAAGSLTLSTLLTELAELANFSRVAGAADAPREQQEAPTGVGAPTGACTETLGETMQFESTRSYRVREVATGLDVSVATIYRAVESGALRARRLGTGKGAVRIPGEAVEEYVAACEAAAVTRADASEFAAGGAA